MKTFDHLYRELYTEKEGVFAPYYYRYLGYKQNMSAPIAVLRANGIYTLFTESTPVILKNEWIAGNTLSLYSCENSVVLDHAKTVVQTIGKRSFFTNEDHYAPNYDHILRVGLPGLIAEIDVSMQRYQCDADKMETLKCMRHTLEGFSKMIQNYICAAEQCKGDALYDKEKLVFIIQNGKHILNEKPSTFAQALQLLWYCHTAFKMEERFAMAFGRLDQLLYPFYKADREAGVLTDEQAIELLENVFIKIPNDLSNNDVVNICIGGQDKHGNCQINELSRCILKAVGNCNVPGPNLSLRLTENTPDEFLDECLKVIGTGIGYPAIMNDDINIAALKRYGYDEDDIYNYSMVGCVENFITGKQPPWSDGRFDTPRYLDYVFNNGVSETNRSFGINTGDVETITSMQEFMDALEKQLAYGADEYCTLFHAKNTSINQVYYTEPFLSCFCEDCIGRGLDMHNGGSIYPSVHGVGLMGIATMADSLSAIEKVVFVDRQATLSEIKQALNDNFEGHEALREKLLAAPKYGNNDDFVDKYAVWFVNYLDSLFIRHKTHDGGGIYIAAASNINNIYAGHFINATPDGRKRFEPLSDAASPTYGRDIKGATSSVSSVSKSDYTKIACGSVVNQKYSPSMFNDEKRKKLMALIRTYFKKGGQEIQINSTSREILEEAMEHPEKYQGLVVRVSGFSAFYVTLKREVQLDILSRTQQG